ncbi:hypothetical protein FHP25_33545 [Vineibacter terrae]|uniref:Uncharacterized protein n=1 Tax=Vineibacter terrae TaxID=2586908 RepID=A0A5C8PAB1_9HYPH|nr:hypothetical protein [Vineibacter terrae]TXL70694.1 hypothetical protein FHP25_33545 [Vineibacter terrae]
MEQEPESRGGRLMVWIVGVMGVLIVVGFAILLVEIGRRIFTPKPGAPEPALVTPAPPSRAFGQAEVRIPEGARIESLTASGDRMVAHVRTREGASLGYVIDTATGTLLGVVRFPDTK